MQDQLEINEARRCHECGAQLVAGWRFCNQCRTEVVLVAQPGDPGPSVKSGPPVPPPPVVAEPSATRTQAGVFANPLSGATPSPTVNPRVFESTAESVERAGSLGQLAKRRLPVTVLTAVVVLTIVVGLLIAARLLTPGKSAAMSSEQPPAVAGASAPASPKGMALIPGGSYVIGSDRDKFESPQHSVTLKAFYIDRFEVTRAEYRRFLDATGRTAPPGWALPAATGTDDNVPVSGVSWAEATAFAAWAGKRLPTEQEWEAAARGQYGWAYPWGNEWIAGRANVAGVANGAVTPAGSFPEGASPAGVCDMSGNVVEWTASDAVLYPGSGIPKDDAPNAGEKVFRGGSYKRLQKEATSTWRNWTLGIESRSGYEDFGFRCALDAP